MNAKSRVFRTTLLTSAVALLAAVPALAHKAWLLPSQTVLSAEGWITVDAAVSNDLFYFNHNPLQVKELTVTSPDGTMLAPQNAATGKFRSTFDLELKKPGTYRISLVRGNLNATWKENGQTKRWRGAPADLATQVPAQATERNVRQSQSRVETFVTSGKPSREALKLSGEGLELEPVTHPNDLYAGEPAKFRFLLDGKPAANLAVEVVPGNSRYRDQQDEMKVTTDANGEVTLNWPAAGMYWLEASVEGGKSSVAGVDTRTASYTATFEVLNP